MAFTISVIWKAMQFSAARTISFRPVVRVMPQRMARAPLFQYGAPNPEKAGTR